MTPTDEPLCVAVLVPSERLYRATLRHALAEAGRVGQHRPGGRADGSNAGASEPRASCSSSTTPRELSADAGSEPRPSTSQHRTRPIVLARWARLALQDVESWLVRRLQRRAVARRLPPAELELAIEAVRRGVPFVSTPTCARTCRSDRPSLRTLTHLGVRHEAQRTPESYEDFLRY